MKYLTREKINVYEFIAPSLQPSPLRGEGRVRGVGASVLFLGIVREHSKGKKVLYLEYEAYEEMAGRMIEDLISSARRKFQTESIQVLHRLGRVDLGEVAVVIRVESAHRDEAYAASRYLIEEIKHRIPIWKKEYFADGTSEWSPCQTVIASPHCPPGRTMGTKQSRFEIASSPLRGSSQ